MNKIIFLTLGILFTAASCNMREAVRVLPPEIGQDEQGKQAIEFSKFNPVFRFSGSVPEGWQVSYLPQIESLNVHDQGDSRIFIRYFEASQFLALSTVSILSRQEASIKAHPAVRYEIEKKTDIANFSNQPGWRNERHKLIDIRFSKNNPSLFYVFAYNPDLDEKVSNEFIESLLFHNDQESFRETMTEAKERVTKKPFGIKVSPGNSPVSPERFSGYHTGVDYEILPGEENLDVPVFAICGGPLLEKGQASGYGGFARQECEIEGQIVQVIYGHIDLASVKQKQGDYLLPGEQMAILGEGETSETDGARKHLHLGIYKGKVRDIRGYVQNQSELSNWIDFQSLE